MANVSAPYNFVPLNEKVFFPPWANLVNHDVPFKNGLSGQIKLEIKAETPIFIRGEEEVNDQDSNLKQYRFPKKDNRYYIPGSSIKGEIANVLEIMSFSKLRFFNDEKFNYRDWNNSKIYNKADFSDSKIKGGWLTKTAEGYKITYSTKKIGRISHIELNKMFDSYSNTFSNQFDDRDDTTQTAEFKYNLLKYKEDYIKFGKFKFDTEEKDRKLLCTFNDYDGKEGELVFTGQSSARKEKRIINNELVPASGKGTEFVFWTSDLKPVKLNTEKGKIHQIITNFFLAYNNHKSEKEQTSDWRMWKKQLNNGFRVPVFMRFDERGNLKDFGLSMLYKILYKKSIKEILNNTHFDTREDFISTLFGNIKNKKSKGRIHFSHAFSTNNINEIEQPITLTLGTPKASYYPFYIEQKFRENGKLSNDFEIDGSYYDSFNDGKLSGRKRYPAIKITATDLLNRNMDAPTDTSTTIFPLKKDAQFECKITFHNLLKEELGALLSALTFHNHSNFKHKIGMGKPFGLGCVQISISELKIDNKKEEELDNYLCTYEKIMNTQISNWIQSEQLKELFAIATPVEPNDKLKYLVLDIDNNRNDFTDIKELIQKKNEPPTKVPKALPRYSVFMDINNTLETKLANCDLSNVKFEEKYFVQMYENEKASIVENISTKIEEINFNIDELNKAQKRIEKNIKAEQGISVLFTNFTKYKDQGKVKKMIDGWIKTSKDKIILEKDYDFLEDLVCKMFKAEKNKQKKKWSLDNKKPHPILTKLIAWLGDEEKANKIYKKAIKQ